ncbi:Ig-like domain-containing protein [Chondrinema litorale]|uniref:Ig-like domain-containing protein n=1 Tax=Chondrinema litorale TaxID=2994555 RepID=UPI002542E4A4|nr:Ig-like domain-containing protein [Chondrinema litorale]UZR94746.1 Ig-like domain-containing protein [Chondrinema litorale]
MKMHTKLCLFLLLNLSFLTSIKAQNTFTEKAAGYGLDLDGIKDGGLSFGYLNGDTYLDLIVNTYQDDADHRTRVYFFNPATSSFDDVTAEKCLGCITGDLPGGSVMERSMVIADFNLDGYNDFIRNSAYRLEVYLNNGPSNNYTFGKGTNQEPNFVLYTESLRDANPPNGIPNGMNTEGIGVLDYDNDGDLDLFIENHNWAMEIYKNKGFGTAQFEYVSPSVTGLPEGANNAGDGDYASVTDYNDDGFIDIIARKNQYIPFDFAVNNPNQPGTFIDGIDIQNANNDNKGAVSLYDFDNDGDFDLIWTAADSTVIYRKDKVGFTAMPGSITGIPSNIGNEIDGLACGDIDNDGDIDIFLTDDSGPSFLYINQLNDPVKGPNNGSAFEFKLDNRGINLNADGEGCVFVDFDDDGDLDLYVNINDGPNQYWENNLNNTDYLNVKIVENRDANGNFLGKERMALGATVKLKNCCGNTLSGVREVNGGNGHGTQDPSIVHFGLSGGSDTEYIVEVRFPAYLIDGEYKRDTVEVRVVPSELTDRMITIKASDHTDESLVCNNPPVAVNDTIDVTSDQDYIGNFMKNDSDPDGDELTADTILVTSPQHGTVVVKEDGSFVYTPEEGYTGEDQFTYSIFDPCGVKDEATVYLNVLPCDEIVCIDPIAADDTFKLIACADSLQGSVFANDSTTACSGLVSFYVLSVEGEDSAYFSFTEFEATGFFTFKPDASFSGEASFTYVLSTESATCDILSDTATVNITVNPCDECEAPKLGNDSFELSNCDIKFSGNISYNDTLPAGCDSLVYTLVGSDNPTLGIITLKKTGAFTFDLSDTDYVGTVSFDYAAYCASCDDEVKTYDTATVVIDIVACETCDIPEANADEFTYEKCDDDFTASIALNDVKPESCDSLIYSLDTEYNPEHGIASITAGGILNYSLTDDDFLGTDSLRYFVSCMECAGEAGAADTAWVAITIEACDSVPCFAPTLENDLYSLLKCDEAYLTGNVSVNDIPPFGCDSLVFELIGSGSNSYRDIVIESDGSFTYTLTDTTYLGTDSLQYRAYCYTCEGETAAYDTATVYFEIESCVCPTPILTNDNIKVDNCEPSFTYSIIENDIQPDNCDSLVFNIIDQVNTSAGTPIISADGMLNYTLNDESFVGKDTVTYTAYCYGCEESVTDTAKIFIDIAACCSGSPMLETDVYTFSCTDTYTGNISTNDSKSEDCSNIIYHTQLILSPTAGEIVLEEDGSFTYTLYDTAFVGSDTVIYNAVCESCENTPATYVQDTIIFNIEECLTDECSEVCAPPSAEDDYYSMEDCSEETLEVSVIENDAIDIDCEAITFSIIGSSTTEAGATVSISDEGIVTYLRPSNLETSVTDQFQYSICNDCGVCDTATVSVDLSVSTFKIYELITPNGDEKNDFLWIDGIECYPNNTVKIFNRWGNLVFEINGYENNLERGWSGQVNKNAGIAIGDQVPDGTYLCIVHLDSDTEVSKYVEVRGTDKE